MPGFLSANAEFLSTGLRRRLVRRGYPALRFDIAEIARALIPERSLFRIAAHAVHSGAVEKGCIKGHRHAHRRPAVAGIGGVLEKESCRGDIPGAQKDITASHESGDLVGG
jgi:hypothetical protein